VNPLMCEKPLSIANESVSRSQHARFARGTNATRNFSFLVERWILARRRHQRCFGLVELSELLMRSMVELVRRPMGVEP